jgi:hypothetical protein
MLRLTQHPCHNFNFYHLQLALVMNQYILVKVVHPQHQRLQLHFPSPRLTSQTAFLITLVKPQFILIPHCPSL